MLGAYVCLQIMPSERELSILAAGSAAAASLLVLAHRRRKFLVCQPCDVADDVEMKGGATLLTPPRDAGTQRSQLRSELAVSLSLVWGRVPNPGSHS